MPLSEGVSVAHARALYDKFVKAGRTNVQAADLLGLSNPLACFFCCPLAQRDDAAVGIYKHISEYFGRSVENLEGSNIPRPGWYERAPAHVLALLEDDHRSGPEWWEREFVDATRLTSALLVFDLRED